MKQNKVNQPLWLLLNESDLMNIYITIVHFSS